MIHTTYVLVQLRYPRGPAFPRLHSLYISKKGIRWRAFYCSPTPTPPTISFTARYVDLLFFIFIFSFVPFMYYHHIFPSIRRPFIEKKDRNTMFITRRGRGGKGCIPVLYRMYRLDIRLWGGGGERNFNVIVLCIGSPIRLRGATEGRRVMKCK